VHAVTARGRWVWALSGLATAAVLAVPGARLLSHPGLTYRNMTPPHTITRTVSVTEPITSLNVQSQAGAVLVHSGSGHTVRVTEYISYDKSAAPPPAVPGSVSGGRLTLADPACADGADCGVAFVDGGSLELNGLTGALHADTGGGPLTARDIDGPATIATDGGSLELNGLTGALQADSGGGPLTAQNVTAPTATVTTGGGSAGLVFAAAPQSVTLFTDGGPAALDVPGGPYALDTDSDGGPVSVHIATRPSAPRTLNVSSSGGSLTVAPAGTR
jgi:hypothetical protein